MHKNLYIFSFLIFGLLFFITQNSVGQSIPLSKGDKVADFTAKASFAGDELDISLKETLKKGPVVLYFFPSAYTNGCDLEASTFSEYSDKFKEANTTVIGVSADDLDRLHKFSADPDFCAGDFAVAPDPNGKIAKDFGLEMSPPRAGATDVNGNKITHGFLPRVTFVIDKNSRIIAVFSSKTDGISPDEHVKKSLSVVRGL